MLGCQLYLKIRLNQDGRMVSCTPRPHIPPRKLLDTNCCCSLSGPQGYWVRAEGIGQLKTSKNRSKVAVLSTVVLITERAGSFCECRTDRRTLRGTFSVYLVLEFLLKKPYTANPRITRIIRSEKSSRNTKTRKVNNL
jgi:hypothetical protein